MLVCGETYGISKMRCKSGKPPPTGNFIIVRSGSNVDMSLEPTFPSFWKDSKCVLYSLVSAASATFFSAVLLAPDAASK